MKRFVLLAGLLLFAAPVFSADFLSDLGAYRDQIKRKLNLATTNTTILADTTLNDFVREAVVTTMPLIKGYKIADTIETVKKQFTYALDSILYIDAIVWREGYKIKSLMYLPREQWYEKYKKLTTGTDDEYLKRPSYYDYDDDYFYVYPTPSTAGDTLLVYGPARISAISVAAVSGIPQQYRPAVLLYATWLAAQAISNPLMGTFKAEYEAVVGGINTTLNRRGQVAIPNQ